MIKQRKLKKFKQKLNAYDYFIYIVISLWLIVTLYPFFNIISVSLSSYQAYLKNPRMILPSDITFEAYKILFRNELLFSSFRNTIIITIAHVVLLLAICVFTAYPLSIANFRGKGIFMKYLLVTMLFNGGLIPNFYLIRSIGLYNTLGALFIFGLCPAFSVILMKNFFEGIPESLTEAAIIDGASHITVLFKIMIPLSKSIIATLGLFAAVGAWNSFFNAVVYTKDSSKWTLMVLLREILIADDIKQQMYTDIVDVNAYLNPIMTKNAALIVMIIPIIIVYPFLQKYFMKGVLLGSVKG